jgi:hypothetical protein
VALTPKLIVYGPPPTKQHVLEALSAGAIGFLLYPFIAGDVEQVIGSTRKKRRAAGKVSHPS